MGALGNLVCKCGNTHRTHGGAISVDGTFTCEDCMRRKRDKNG